MNNFLKIITIFLFGFIHLQASSTDDIQKINTDSIHSVIINLEGVIILENSQENNVHIKTTTQREGTVIGFSNKDKIPAYKILSEKKENQLFIKPLKRDKVWSVGINTLTENNTHYLHIPADKNVVIKSTDSKIMINGSFRVLKIENKEGNIDITAAKNSLRYLTCSTTNGDIYFNEIKMEENLGRIYYGVNVIDAITTHGIINLHIQ